MDIRDLIRLGVFLNEKYQLGTDAEVVVVASDSPREVRVRIKPPEWIREETGKFPRVYWPTEYETIVLDWVHPGSASFSYPVLVGYGEKSNTLVVALKGS